MTTKEDKVCPRCLSDDCSDPDSKACSDNCIRRHMAELATLRQYVAHKPNCYFARMTPGEETRFRATGGSRDYDACTCGLVTALAEKTHE